MMPSKRSQTNQTRRKRRLGRDEVTTCATVMIIIRNPIHGGMTIPHILTAEFHRSFQYLSPMWLWKVIP